MKFLRYFHFFFLNILFSSVFLYNYSLSKIIKKSNINLFNNKNKESVQEITLKLKEKNLKQITSLFKIYEKLELKYIHQKNKSKLYFYDLYNFKNGIKTFLKDELKIKNNHFNLINIIYNEMTKSNNILIERFKKIKLRKNTDSVCSSILYFSNEDPSKQFSIQNLIKETNKQIYFTEINSIILKYPENTIIKKNEKFDVSQTFIFKNTENSQNNISYKIFINEKEEKSCFLKFQECYFSCKECILKGDSNNHLCNSCKNNYFPLKNNKSNTYNCYKNTTLIEHYYFDEIKQIFLECGKECLTCFDKSNIYDTNCLICDYNNHYIPSIYDNSNCIKECEKGHRVYISKNNNFKIYHCTEDDNCPEDYPIYNETLNECLDECNDNKYIYKNTCVDSCPDDSLIDEFHKRCYNIPKKLTNLTKEIGEIILSIPHDIELIFNHGKIKVTVYNNSFSENLLINFTECLRVFQSVYNLNDINEYLISKIEFIQSDSAVNKFEYLIFDEKGKLLNLSVCSELNVKVHYIITNETNIDFELAKQFMEKEIDIFNEDDEFFKDICVNFTSEKGTDVTLQDRKTLYYQNISLCDKHCTYLQIDLYNKIVECVCPINSIINSDLNEKENEEEEEDKDENEFSITSNNYEVIFCYKKVFDSKILKINIGNFIMIFIGLIYSILIIEYFIRGRKNIALYIVINKYSKKNNNPPKKNSMILNDNIQKHCKCKSTILEEEINIEEKENREIMKNEKEIEKNERKRKNINILISLHNNYIAKSDYSNNKTLALLNSERNNNPNNNNTINNISLNHETNLTIKSNTKRTTTTFILGPSENNKKNKKKNNIIEEPKTCLEYEEMSFQSALLYDHRNIFYAYWEELKDKQIFLCLFFNKGLMLKQLKIASFIIATATDFFFNAFFYTDKFISKNYEEGALEYAVTLPKTILSSILAQLFSCFLDYLISSKMILLFLKKKKKKNDIYYRQCNSLISMCICKIRVFIGVTFFSLVFFWYYITAFCAVYQNSQINWIKDTLNSFWISLLTPLALCFISLLLRNISLKKKNKIIYNISKILMMMV